MKCQIYVQQSILSESVWILAIYKVKKLNKKRYFDQPFSTNCFESLQKRKVWCKQYVTYNLLRTIFMVSFYTVVSFVNHPGVVRDLASLLLGHT
jgi:hypothetical protein